MKKLLSVVLIAVIMTMTAVSAFAEDKESNYVFSTIHLKDSVLMNFTSTPGENQNSKDIDYQVEKITYITTKGRILVKADVLTSIFKYCKNIEVQTKTGNGNINNIVIKDTAKGYTAEFFPLTNIVALDWPEHKEAALDVMPAVVDNDVYIPLRAALELFGYNVRWNAENSTITVTPNPPEGCR